MARNWIVIGAARAAIVALAWWLADNRIGVCGDFESGCRVQVTAARDCVLVWGAIVPLALFVLLTIAGRARIRRINLRWPHRDRNPPSVSRELVITDRSEGSA